MSPTEVVTPETFPPSRVIAVTSAVRYSAPNSHALRRYPRSIARASTRPSRRPSVPPISPTESKAGNSAATPFESSHSTSHPKERWVFSPSRAASRPLSSTIKRLPSCRADGSGRNPTVSISSPNVSSTCIVCCEIRMFSSRLNWIRTLPSQSVVEAYR